MQKRVLEFRRRARTVALSATTLALAHSAFGATLSTGAASWSVNGNPAVVETGVLPTFPGGWVQNFSDGRWVGTTASDGNFGLPTDGALANGAIYTFSLNLGAVVPAGGSFSLQYAADNAVTWSITNGSLAGDTTCGSGNINADCFSSLRTLTGTFSSTSTLFASVVNGPTGVGTRTPMGLLAVGVTAPVPEPSSWALFALGGVSLVFARRTLTRRQAVSSAR